MNEEAPKTLDQIDLRFVQRQLDEALQTSGKSPRTGYYHNFERARGGWAPCHAGENSPWKASGSGYSSHARATGPSATCRASKTAMPVNPRT